MFHGDICTVSIITWGLDKYGHFNDVILNRHQVYSIGGATHIHNLNNCPRANAFLCKKKAAYILKSCRLHEWKCTCLRALAFFNQKDGQLYSFFSYSGGGLQWFVVVCGGLPASSLVSLPMPQILVVICGHLR